MAILEQPMGCPAIMDAEDIGANSDAARASTVEMDQKRRMVNREYTFTLSLNAIGFSLQTD